MSTPALPPGASAPDHAEVRLTLDALAPDDGTGLRLVAHDGAHTLTIDSGKGARGPSPTHTLLLALGGCTAMDVISILRKQRQQVTGYEVIVRVLERRIQHPRAFTKVEILHRVRGTGLDSAAIARAIELSDTTYCSVHAMLAGIPEMTSRFEVEEG